jgi:hypothetical protein
MDGDENHPDGNDQSSDEQEPEDEAGIDSPEAWEDEKNPYMVSEKREVSDEELWQQGGCARRRTYGNPSNEMSHRHELTRSNGVKRSQWALDWCLHFAIERPDIG